MPLHYYLHPLTFAWQAPHTTSPCPSLKQLPFCLWASFQYSWKWMLHFSIQVEKSSHLAWLCLTGSYRRRQTLNEERFLKQQVSILSFLRKLWKLTTSMHTLQWNYSDWQYWSNPIPTELRQGRACDAAAYRETWDSRRIGDTLVWCFILINPSYFLATVVSLK